MNMREEICRKLRATVSDRGQKMVTPAIILGPWDLESPIGGHQYLVCQTLGEATLANVDFKTARCFEDA
jgi:hypothetical protein